MTDQAPSRVDKFLAEMTRKLVSRGSLRSAAIRHRVRLVNSNHLAVLADGLRPACPNLGAGDRRVQAHDLTPPNGPDQEVAMPILDNAFSFLSILLSRLATSRRNVIADVQKFFGDRPKLSVKILTILKRFCVFETPPLPHDGNVSV